MRKLGIVIARGIELILGVSGLSYFILSDEDAKWEVAFLAAWSFVAFTYICVGTLVVRRWSKTDPGKPMPPTAGWAGSVFTRRLGFLLTVAASLTGMNAALSALADHEDEAIGAVVPGLGVLAMVSAWVLLHSGYARFYSYWSEWKFPACPHPGPTEFLYFAFTVGVSFAASDVEVQNRTLRWHVMVHSVISFFYNAVVLAVAVSIITGK
ncbi:hypothetical protein Rhe02_29080 [Rhizocola hellebori]|uniref:DUF1345 domain-containing protein n=1 Tax=Rhizocola hellebori TaxID=1392758 RepID=A0A8J3VG94_9ACTN|nr:DUF1345 domain-containing protein [Rhizocola hellebori]GIH04841.1 hypothetical protein Rhe02_29080 [Rhizocola hellebori]